MKWVKGDIKAEFVHDGDERPEISDGSIRRLKSLETMFYPCKNCRKQQVCRVNGTVCADCLNNDEYKNKIQKESEESFQFKGFKDTVAFGHDKATGQPIAIDKKGRRINPEETIYAKHKNDKYGWKATGKRVKDPNYGKEAI